MDSQQTASQSDDTVTEVAESSQSTKQQVAEKINSAKNVLVTVGTNPTVDELATALGLTFLLGKLQKHATAVFSGTTPPAIDFLDPRKTFERSVDSLRDFIIALDKEKADKLRYKVEEDVVKVFITPYKSNISEKDLQFSQGDFNVDVVLALGISKREELDKAILAHGRILHDADVITVNAGSKTSSLGSIDWSDPAASSVAEMLVGISESFGSGLLDEQISTALLTGIVAETNRFSNQKTSPKVMTMAAQLMAAGANQQLIATNLRQEGMISESVRDQKPNQSNDNGEMVLDHGDKKPANTNTKPKSPPKMASKNISAPKEEKSTSNEPASPVLSERRSTTEEVVKTEGPAITVPEPATSVAPTPAMPPLVIPPAPAPTPAPAIELPPLEAPAIKLEERELVPESAVNNSTVGSDQKPAFGGTLSATSAQAEQEKSEQQAHDREEAAKISSTDEEATSNDAIEAARRALEEITDSQPFSPANNPVEAIGSQPLPPVREEAPIVAPLQPIVVPDATAGEVQAQTVVQQNSAQQAAQQPDPMDAFMQSHQEAPAAPNQLNAQSAMPTFGAASPQPLPPLPPMPVMPGGGTAPAMPPMPPLPGQSAGPAAGFQPQINPGFMDNIPQSQNSWTQAGEEMAAKQAQKEEVRQNKLDQMTAQYDAAVEKNRELQANTPSNNDHSTFPLPPTS